MSQPALERTQPFHGPATRERWERAWQHREDLLKVARRRTLSEDEAQDAVSEALIRAVQADGLDEERIAAWLTRVTMNLCTDIARDRARSSRRAEYTRLHLVPEPSPEQTVIDRDLAAAVVRRMARLPRRQREALLLRASGFTVDDIAQQLRVSYKSAESLLARARTSLRGAIAIGIAAVVGIGHGLRRAFQSGPAGVAASVLAAATFAAATLPHGSPETGSGQTVPHVVMPLHLDAKHVPVTQVRLERPTQHAPSKTVAEARQMPHHVRNVTPPAHPVVPNVHVQSGPVEADTGGLVRHPSDKSTVGVVTGCLRDGVVVSPAYVGCPR